MTLKSEFNPAPVSGMSNRGRNGFMGTGDLRPPVYREGSMDHLKHGSRRGDEVVPYQAPQAQCVGVNDRTYLYKDI